MQAPTTNRVTQARHGTYNAVDYSARPDPTIYAPEDGKITAYGPSGRCGNRLELTAGPNRHGFCHLEKPLVRVGQKVKRGQSIGIMGYTGYTRPAGPAGSHLHHVINRNGVYVYPPSLVTQVAKKEEEMIKDADNEYGRWKKLAYQIRGRNLTRTEFIGSAVGRSWLQAMETLSDDKEADRNTKDAEIGKKARVEEWQSAHRDATKLTSQLIKMETELVSMTNKAKAKQAEVDGLVDSQAELIKAHKEDMKKVQALVNTKNKEVERLAKQLEGCGGKPEDCDCDNMTIRELFAQILRKLLSGKE
jgi:septal ring factor EnvC (AmiA/AmiB activator)